MEPAESVSNNIYLHITAGDAGKNPEVISCQSQVTYHTEQIEKVKQQLMERGIGKELLNENQHLFVIELSCNPGCEKELVQELTRIINQEQNQEEETIFAKVIGGFFKDNAMECKVFESQSKVYLCAHETEKRQYSENSKIKAFYDNFRPQGNINMSFSAQGIKQVVEDSQSLSVSLFDFTLEYPNSKDISTRLQKYLSAIEEQFPLIAMLSQIKRLNIRAKINSLDEISKNINFQVVDKPILHLFNQGKTLIQNEFRVYYLNNSGFLIDTTVKIDDMRFMLSKYLFSACLYIRNIF